MHRGNEKLGFQPIRGEGRLRYWSEFLSPGERRFAGLSIFTAKASRLLSNWLGRRCSSYTWFDPDGVMHAHEVVHHRWNFPG
jgi:hypothetical protein